MVTGCPGFKPEQLASKVYRLNVIFPSEYVVKLFVIIVFSGHISFPANSSSGDKTWASSEHERKFARTGKLSQSLSSI